MKEDSREPSVRVLGGISTLQSRARAFGLARQLGFAWKPAAGAGDFVRVFPFRRHWVAIAILLAFDIVFIGPAISTFAQAASAWASVEDLFGLTTALFLTAWLMGWCLAPLAMTAGLAVLLFGREVVTARRGLFELYLGLPLLGVAMRFDPRHLRNLRLETPAEKSGKSWRGPHAVFDYGEDSVEFGIDVDETELERMRASIEVATGQRVEDRDATPEELAAIEAQRAGAAGDREKLRSRDRTRALVDPPGEDPAGSSSVEPAAPAGEPLSLGSPTVLALIAANLIPLAGTVFFGWELSHVMVLYWAETAIIGLWNLARMWVIGRWLAIPSGIFFLGHFGGFMAVHFMFIWMIFVQGMAGFSGGEADGGGDLGAVAGLFGALAPALLALFVSHGYSFFTNFIGRREYAGRKLSDQMGEPYGRVIFMHLVLILGGGLALALGGPTLVIIGVIALKIVFDVRAHLKQHGSREG